MLKRTIILLAAVLVFLGMFQTAAAKAPVDTIKIACVGNSITEGYTTSNPLLDSYPGQLGTLLGSGYQVKNCGVSGRTLLRKGDFPIWNEQKFRDALTFNPDIVTIMLGTNDSKPYNWIYKNEFVDDYKAMVDTFRSLPSQPVVWLCLPAPAWSGAWDISDSVIFNDIIPMIQQVAADKGCPVIDFYNGLQGDSILFPDGIHPNNAGSAHMAEIFYSALTGNPIIQVKDENAAAGCTVTASGSLDPDQYGADNLVDGKNASVWKTTGFPAQAVIDLDSVQTIDLFQINFGNASRVGYQFMIEVAEIENSWITTIDHTARTDTAGIILERVDQGPARYIRLTINGASYPNGDTISIAEMRVVKANGGAHAPVIRAKRLSQTTTRVRYNLTLLWPTYTNGAVIFFRQSGTGGFSTMIGGYRVGSTYPSTNESITLGAINKYYATSFLNGVKTTTDTLVIDTTPLSIRDSDSPLKPEGAILYQAYPNPFNASTMISFRLPSSGFVSLKIYNLLGKEITTLISGELSGGRHVQPWDASNFPSGIYFYRLQSGKYDVARKMILMR